MAASASDSAYSSDAVFRNSPAPPPLPPLPSSPAYSAAAASQPALLPVPAPSVLAAPVPAAPVPAAPPAADKYLRASPTGVLEAKVPHTALLIINYRNKSGDLAKDVRVVDCGAGVLSGSVIKKDVYWILVARVPVMTSLSYFDLSVGMIAFPQSLKSEGKTVLPFGDSLVVKYVSKENLLFSTTVESQEFVEFARRPYVRVIRSVKLKGQDIMFLL